MFGAISAKFRTFDMQIHFAIPPNSAFLGLLEEFFFSISNIRKFHHIINQFVKKFSTFPDSPYFNGVVENSYMNIMLFFHGMVLPTIFNGSRCSKRNVYKMASFDIEASQDPHCRPIPYCRTARRTCLDSSVRNSFPSKSGYSISSDGASDNMAR